MPFHTKPADAKPATEKLQPVVKAGEGPLMLVQPRRTESQLACCKCLLPHLAHFHFHSHYHSHPHPHIVILVECCYKFPSAAAAGGSPPAQQLPPPHPHPHQHCQLSKHHSWHFPLRNPFINPLAWSKILYTAVGTFANHEKETASLRKMCSASAACGLDYFMPMFRC